MAIRNTRLGCFVSISAEFRAGLPGYWIKLRYAIGDAGSL